MKNRIVINGKSSLAIVFLLVSSASFGQYVKDYKKNADAYYAKGDYYSAAVYYEKYLTGDDKAKGGSAEPYTIQKKGAAVKAEGNSKDDNYDEIAYRIAESYRTLNDYTHAEKWYAEAVKFDKAKYPDAAYWYGVSLRANSKYAEAQQQLESYLQSGKHAFSEQAKLELADVKFIQEQMKRKDASLYNVQKLGETSQGANYAAAWGGNTMLFTSTRPDSSLLANKKKSPFVNALYIKEQGGAAEKVAIPAASNMEQGVAALSPDGNRLYLTRWVSSKEGNMSAIYMSQKSGSSWGEPVKLDANVNVEAYSSQQPFVTADGKYLLFASNRPSGSGKFDIWYAPLNANGEAGKAVNMGRTINTKEDDQAPFYHQPSGTLVVASKGRLGMGGYDLYQSKGAIGDNWQEPQNLGYPVNSNKDDIYFAARGTGQLLKDASISSDRSSVCCLELFSVAKTYKKYITGVVTDCKTNQPIDASVKLSVPGTLISSTNGKFIYELNDFSASQISASKDAYTEGSITLKLPENADADTLYNADLCLTPVESVIENPVVKTEPPLEEIVEPVQPQKKTPKVALFNFAMYELRPQTKVVLDTLAALLNREPMLGIKIIGYTDQKGTDGYNIKLSELRALECKKYLMQNGVPESRITIKALGESNPVEKETTKSGKDNPKARQANRRVEFKISLL